ncbi:MAG: hypothetical protein MI919_07965 [Holophagales bacterium]|nr:hypothetical protein [Holophagales bacterium]
MWLLSWMTALALAGAGSSPAVDPASLVGEARRVQQEDLATWSHLEFRRQVLREKLDEHDAVVSTEVLDFLVTPLGDGRFDERLRRLDGRAPSASQVREHRRAQRFEKRYRTAFVGEASEYEKGDFSLAHFMTRPTYRYGGLERVDGILCHRLDFPADTAGIDRGGVASRLSAGTAGTLWLETEGLHAIRAESRLVQPISAMMGLVRVQRVNIEMTTLRFGRHRLPREISVTTTTVIAGRALRKRNRFVYGDHRPATGGPAAAGH